MNALRSFFNDTFGSETFYSRSGEYSFYVDVLTMGTLPYTNSVLSVSAFKDETKKTPIAVQYTWFRQYTNSKEYLLANGNTYPLSAMDVGSEILVEISPFEVQSQEKCVITFGPFNLDPNSRKTLQGIIQSKGSEFIIESIADKEPQLGLEQRGSLNIRERDFSISFDTQCVDEYRKPLSIGIREKFEMVAGPGPLSLTLVIRGMNELIKVFLKDGKGTRIVLGFATQSIRDMVMMSLRIFESKAFLEDELIFERMRDRLFGYHLSSSTLDFNLDLVTRNDTLKNENKYLLQRNEQLGQEINQLKQVNFEQSQQIRIPEEHEDVHSIKNIQAQINNDLKINSRFDTSYNIEDVFQERRLDKEKIDGLNSEIGQLREKVQRLDSNIKDMKFDDMGMGDSMISQN